MLIEELVGKRITNIFQILDHKTHGLDRGECFIELDNEIIIEIPYDFDVEVSTKLLHEKASSIFDDLSDYPIYRVNKEGKSIQEIVDKYGEKKQTIYQKLHQILFGKKTDTGQIRIAEYEPYEIKYVENKLKHIKDRTIIDFIRFGYDDEKGFLELDNGYLISETNFSPNGTGRVGINIYDNFGEITQFKRSEFRRITGKKK